MKRESVYNKNVFWRWNKYSGEKAHKRELSQTFRPSGASERWPTSLRHWRRAAPSQGRSTRGGRIRLRLCFKRPPPLAVEVTGAPPGPFEFGWRPENTFLGPRVSVPPPSKKSLVRYRSWPMPPFLSSFTPRNHPVDKPKSLSQRNRWAECGGCIVTWHLCWHLWL